MLGTELLGTKDAIATIGVKDLARAKEFYGETLGLRRSETGGSDQVLTFSCGKTALLVYKSDFAGTNRATAVTWSVGQDVDAVVGALKDEGVRFEHYDMPGMRRDGDVHVDGNMKAAWFKDPDGNILAIVSG